MIEQRCIFHKLRNVADKGREELRGEAHKETRKQLMEQASAVYQAESAEEARGQLAVFAQTWRARTPKAVATFERDFEQTIASYALEGVARELIRTTSLLERTNRELRRKFRQACCFGSLKGAEVAISLQVTRLNARWSKQTWWAISHDLSFDFLHLNHPGRPPARYQESPLTLFQRSPAEPDWHLSAHPATLGIVWRFATDFSVFGNGFH